MNQYFLLPFVYFLVVGCSLEIGNEHSKRRLPVDNKQYLAKQKQEKILSRKSVDQTIFEDDRYQFRDSERPKKRKYREEYVEPVEYENANIEFDDQDYEEEGCSTFCGDNRFSIAGEAPQYHPDYTVRGSGTHDDYGMHDKHSNKSRHSTTTPHVSHGDYSVTKHQEVVIKPPLKKKRYISQKKISNKKAVQAKTTGYGSVANLSMDDYDHEPYSSHSSDDEGIPTIPPRVNTSNDMDVAYPIKQNRASKAIPKAHQSSMASTDLSHTSSTVQEADQNIANIKSQIESQNIQEKQQIQQNSIGMQSSYNKDMNTKLSQLEALTSQAKESSKVTPNLPSSNQVPTQNLKAPQKKLSSQEVHLAVDSDNEKDATSVGTPSRSDLPPPVDLSQ